MGISHKRENLAVTSTVSVCILDYGSGNVRSVENIITYLGYDVFVSNDASRIRDASHLILPGVGTFGAAMVGIREKISIDVLEEQVLVQKKPFLGICVGMQVLADIGHENGRFPGLGWISGEVTLLKSNNMPLPHIGWNDLDVATESPLFIGLSEDRNFYFLHSYTFEAKDPTLVSSRVDYGAKCCASIQVDNIHGVQFHPEKSQKTGQLLFHNFLMLK
jgi:imidazole glycerol-phosphate synthase subunit HisH